MSRHSRSSTILENAEALEIIREEQGTPIDSETEVNDASNDSSHSKPRECPADCACQDVGGIKFGPEEIEKMLKEKEDTLRTEFDKELEKELKHLREKFDFVLQNEQVRAGYMLREAHRERQEKVQALQAQLECKNIAGLMYVLCSERRKSKLEKLRIIEDYTNYIEMLQGILSDGQALILHLSRGYKTAARVDHEWREKMKKVLKEFQEYVYHFAGGPPDTNQYVFDIPALLKTEAALTVNPEEDPCDCEEEQTVQEEPEPAKTWWEKLEAENRPFVMFGDMADFKPPQRREVLKTVKAAKTAPPKWKEYAFNEMFLKSGCPNVDSIKDEYPKRLPVDKWECQAQIAGAASPFDVRSRESSRRYTTTSMDMKTAMGSILRMITTSNVVQQQSSVKANILAARDSMEIASTTRLREKRRESSHGSKCVSISVGLNKSSLHHPSRINDDLSEDSELYASGGEEDGDITTKNGLGTHHDSLQIIPGHVPDTDHKINYEKICPMEKCQRMQVDSFMRTLPSYMRESPFTYFEHTYENYETCSRAQLEILKHRIAEKQSKTHRVETEENPLDEWTPSVEGVAVQTSDLSMSGFPPCECRVPSPTPATSVGRVFNVEDLIPMKEAIDEITKECFYDDHIQFNRFKVIGQENSNTTCHIEHDKKDFKQGRVMEIKKILKRHPSLLDLFQGNTQC